MYSFGKGRYGKLGLAESLLDVENEDDSHLPGAIKDLYLDVDPIFLIHLLFSAKKSQLALSYLRAILLVHLMLL